MTAWQTIVSQPSELGESPFWHPGERKLYWVDIPGRRIQRAEVASGAVESWSLPQEPGCIAPAARGGLVMALRDGFYRAQRWGGELQCLARIDHDTATTRFNDGKCDPLGRFWAGSMYEPRDRACAALYALDGRDGRAPQVERMAGDATLANGLAWSPDARTVYWADTVAHAIRAWDWNAEANQLSNPRLFRQFPPKPAGWTWGDPAAAPYGGRPDGAAVDALGNYYAAMYEGRRLLKFSPAGELLAEIPTPVQCPTMPCFGGDDLKTLYLTTSRHGRSARELAEQPLAGCVFALRMDTPGLPVNFYRD